MGKWLGVRECCAETQYICVIEKQHGLEKGRKAEACSENRR